jgi:hypothetical protein
VSTTPVALLPLRLETRYSADGSTLRVRIFPDDIHVDALDRGVDDQERMAAVAYWQAVWDPADRPDPDPWQQLIAIVGPRRAPWVAEALRPTNEAARPNDPPAFPAVNPRTRPPAQVHTLPTLFRAYAFTTPVGAATPSFTTADSAAVRDPLIVGPPTDSDGTVVQFQNGVPVVGAELGWLSDFDAAKAAGMAMEIPLATPFQPIDHLVVVGMRDDLDAATGSQRLGDLLTAHTYTDGAAFLPQASPTNNTDTDRSAWSRAAQPNAPQSVPTFAGGSNADVLARALGIPAATLAPFDHASDREQPWAQAMITALWNTTWEVIFAKLTNPTTPGASLSAVQREQLRTHATSYVRGRGPIPALRIGKQPYGLIPAVDLNAYRPTTATIADGPLAAFLARARRLWRAGVADVPTVMSGDLESALPEILGSSPVMSSLRVRSLTVINKCYEPLPALVGQEAADNCDTQQGLDQMAHELLGFEATALLPTGQLAKATRTLGLPLTNPSSDRTYIAALIVALRSPDPVVLPEEHSVLQALLGLAYAIETQEWTNATADDGVTTLHNALPHFQGNVDVGLVQNALRAVQTIGHADPLPIVDRALQAISASGVPRLNANTLLAAYPIDAVRPPALVTAATRNNVNVLTTVPITAVQLSGEILARFKRHSDFEAALITLQDVLEDQRALLVAEVLDTSSHRLDAWLTSLATARLDAQRAAGIEGVTLGAYGYVHGIVASAPVETRPPAGADGIGPVFMNPRDGGFIHAPSLDHAATAGVLRSARLTHDPGDSGSPALSIDLSSRRVRTAVQVITGIRQGQPLGALLGYRLERRLHELSQTSGRQLDRYIYVLRSVAPLRAGKLTDPEASVVPVAQEVNAVANVVDGARLLDLYAMANGPALISQRLTDGPDDATLTTYIARWGAPAPGDLDAVLGAIGELAQVNDAVADLLLAEGVHQLVRGNQAGAAAALNAAGGGDGFPPDPDVIRTPRSGSAFTYRLVVLTPLVTPSGTSGWSDAAVLARTYPELEAWARSVLGPATRVVLAAEPLDSLANHELCALDVVTLAGPALRERLAGSPLAIRPAEWGRGIDRLVLSEIEALAVAARAVLASARPLTGTAVAAATELADAPPRSAEFAELITQTTAARTALANSAPPEGSADAMRLGIATAALAIMQSAGTDEAKLAALATAVAALAGPDVPVLPILPAIQAPGRPDELAAALADPPDARGLRPWLARWAGIRAGTGRYAAMSLYRQALGADPALRLYVVPHAAGEPWVGQPAPAGGTISAAPRLSLIAEVAATPPEPTAVVHGFIVDEWADVLPSLRATTAAAVNAPAPSARPPQAVLIAVTPDGGDWSLDRLRDVVIDTLQLAQERGVTLERVPLAPRIIPALYVRDWSLQGQATPVMAMAPLANVVSELTHPPKFVKG